MLLTSNYGAFGLHLLIQRNMEFAINYNHGYVVCLLQYDEGWHRKRFFPLRNFGEHQGDARIFKEVDCPSLNDAQLKMLIKNYRNDIIYKRINSRRFVRE